MEVMFFSRGIHELFGQSKVLFLTYLSFQIIFKATTSKNKMKEYTYIQKKKPP